MDWVVPKKPKLVQECEAEIMSESDEDRLRLLMRKAEEAYSAMYDAPDPSSATARYSDAKECLHTAIGLARTLGEIDLAKQLTERLAHIKAVFRSQFS